jgi:CheY-like chemotaxis protein
MFENTSVLVVEDNARSLMTISSLLKALGIHFKRNTTGAGVVEQVLELQPNLVLLNTDLPDGDPCAICRAIRQHTCIAHTPVVAMADDFPPGSIKLLCDSGFSDFLHKPLSRQLFSEQLKNFLIDKHKLSILDA